MIATLHGNVEAVMTDALVVNVGGVGFQVYVPASTISSHGRIGKTVKLFTYLYVREDTLSLYGFSTSDELRFFQLVTGVSGIGPRLALSMLSTMSVEQLTMAIATGNADLLNSIPGVGKKIASRLILELKDKVGTGLVVGEFPVPITENNDVIAALVSLGYSTAEASRAVASLPADNDLNLEDRIKLALQYFARK